MVVAQELGEVVEQHEEHAQCAAVEHAHGRRELRGREVGVEELEEADEQPLHERPALLPLGEQQLGHEHAVRDELHPREGEAGQPRRLQRVEGRAEGREHLRLDRVERRVGRVEVEEPAREEAEVGALVEVAAAVVAQQQRHERGQHALQQLHLRLGLGALGGVGALGRHELDHEQHQLGERVERREGADLAELEDAEPPARSRARPCPVKLFRPW